MFLIGMSGRVRSLPDSYELPLSELATPVDVERVIQGRDLCRMERETRQSVDPEMRRAI